MRGVDPKKWLSEPIIAFAASEGVEKLRAKPERFVSLDPLSMSSEGIATDYPPSQTDPNEMIRLLPAPPNLFRLTPIVDGIIDFACRPHELFFHRDDVPDDLAQIWDDLASEIRAKRKAETPVTP